MSSNIDQRQRLRHLCILFEIMRERDLLIDKLFLVDDYPDRVSDLMTLRVLSRIIKYILTLNNEL
jgi:hypothetical protein